MANALPVLAALALLTAGCLGQGDAPPRGLRDSLSSAERSRGEVTDTWGGYPGMFALTEVHVNSTQPPAFEPPLRPPPAAADHANRTLCIGGAHRDFQHLTLAHRNGTLLGYASMGRVSVGGEEIDLMPGPERLSLLWTGANKTITTSDGRHVTAGSSSARLPPGGELWGATVDGSIAIRVGFAGLWRMDAVRTC